MEPTNPEEKIVGVLVSGENVVVASDSHYYTHPDTHKGIKEALSKIDSATLNFGSQETVQVEVVLSGEEGRSICVPTAETDSIVFAKRAPRTWYTRFVLDREPIPTGTMSVVLQAGPQTSFSLITAFWGPAAPREPGDSVLIFGTRGYEEARSFWEKHALVLPRNQEEMRKLGVEPEEVKEVLGPGEEYFRSR